jgi:hypothetical protein
MRLLSIGNDVALAKEELASDVMLMTRDPISEVKGGLEPQEDVYPPGPADTLLHREVRVNLPCLVPNHILLPSYAGFFLNKK